MPPANKTPSPKRQAPLGSLPRLEKPRERKSPALSVYLDPDEADVIRREAAERGLNVSEFVRDRMMHDIWYKTGDLVDQVHLLAHDSHHHAALESYFRSWVERHTGFAMSPPAEALAAEQTPAAVMAVPASPPLQAPASVEAPISLAEPVAELKAVSQTMKGVSEKVTGPTYTYTDAVIDLLSGLWRKLNQAQWRNDQFYGKVGRTPLRFLLAAAMLAALPEVFGRTEVGHRLLGDDRATASPALTDLPGPVQNLIAIGTIVDAVPDNGARLNSCVKRQQKSRRDFWCKFRMKAGA